jgi:hypothetical protein
MQVRVVALGEVHLPVRVTHPGAVCASAALLLAAPLAAAGPCPPIGFGPPHASLDEAAIARLHTLFRDNDRFESGGFLIEQNGVFRSSKPVTQRARTEVSYCIVLPRGAKLAGLYHTHVANAAFSSRDRDNAARAGVPSYIGTLGSGTLRVLEPELGTARALPVRTPKPHGDADDAPAPAGTHVVQWLASAARRAWELLRTLRPT